MHWVLSVKFRQDNELVNLWFEAIAQAVLKQWMMMEAVCTCERSVYFSGTISQKDVISVLLSSEPEISQAVGDWRETEGPKERVLQSSYT
jgi:hypothetical protein